MRKWQYKNDKRARVSVHSKIPTPMFVYVCYVYIYIYIYIYVCVCVNSTNMFVECEWGLLKHVCVYICAQKSRHRKIVSEREVNFYLHTYVCVYAWDLIRIQPQVYSFLTQSVAYFCMLICTSCVCLYSSIPLTRPVPFLVSPPLKKKIGYLYFWKSTNRSKLDILDSRGQI